MTDSDHNIDGPSAGNPEGSPAEAAPEPRRPTVLQVLPGLVTGGVERGTVDMADALVRAGWRAMVASSGGPMVRELERVGGEHVTLPLASKNPIRMRKNAKALEELIAMEGVDIVHARSRAPAWSAWWATRRTGTPFVTSFHAPYSLGGPLGGPLKRLYNSVMTKGDRVIAISEFISRHILDNYPVDPEKLRVIPRGADVAIFDPERVSAERMIQLSEAWRLEDGVPVVMLPGRLTRWKGQGVLIEAMAHLRDLPVLCVLVGSDQGRVRYREELEALTERLNLKSVVRFAGECRDMAAGYMLADVVVSASIEPEGFGRVSVEAQAMGKPVVGSNHGGVAETVLPGQTGWLVPAEDPAALAAALRAALTLDNGQREQWAARAIAHVRDNYTKDLMCDRTLAVYAELLG
ncbi:glycosyltransferase family 4 protein [Oceanibaculum nanhaiense]|uniref:glycosyltransferase family 4 protein n=1 Tax=Oceanibaculum nanhaiense TaxID=1909734 RepID=UPI000A3B3617|nr:glycosyltransferase family 4 protein [Oceanibaculum nanhaiense]MBC7135566.1 glycosyltransferase family 4 protein [Oceanibaculum nanhaiense]